MHVVRMKVRGTTVNRGELKKDLPQLDWVQTHVSSFHWTTVQSTGPLGYGLVAISFPHLTPQRLHIHTFSSISVYDCV